MLLDGFGKFVVLDEFIVTAEELVFVDPAVNIGLIIVGLIDLFIYIFECNLGVTNSSDKTVEVLLDL